MKCNRGHQSLSTEGQLDVLAHSQGFCKDLEFHCLLGFEYLVFTSNRLANTSLSFFLSPLRFTLQSLLFA